MVRILLLCVAIACTPPGSGPSPAPAPAQPSPDPAVELIVSDLQGRQPGALAGARIDRSRLMISRDTSQVLAGVAYTWGVYAPPRTADAVMVSVVASRGDRHELLSTPADWARVAGFDSWVPRSAADAIAGCEELVRVTSVFRTPSWPARVYRDSSSTPWGSLTAPARVASLVRPPTAVRENDGWITDVWMIEYGRVGEHRCQFTRDAVVTHTILQSVRNIGFH